MTTTSKRSVRLGDFDRVVFFTGAGMSAESGVPTFRGKGGIWKEYDHQRYACQPAFDEAPERVWEFHNYRRQLVARCQPNAGHCLIARFQQERPGAVVVTQNIDGLHQQAGSERVTELHGSLWRLRCACGARAERRDAPLADPRCAGCGAYWRPDIVWFGDTLGDDELGAAAAAIATCQLLISIGTSAVVYPAARMPLEAKRAGALLVEINPDETPLSDAYDIRLRGPASEMLARLAEGL
jgi:NAD-dependent deacetylase